MSIADVSFSWVIPLIAALGIGSFLSAMVGKAVAISNHRQNWIDALRDDLVSFLKEVDVLHFRMAKILGPGGTTDDLEKQQDARNAAMMAYRRVLMRLNMTEELHVNLAHGLRALMTVSTTTADENKINAVVNASREVLKYEWAVAKYGMWLRWRDREQFRKKKQVTSSGQL